MTSDEILSLASDSAKIARDIDWKAVHSEHIGPLRKIPKACYSLTSPADIISCYELANRHVYLVYVITDSDYDISGYGSTIHNSLKQAKASADQIAAALTILYDATFEVVKGHDIVYKLKSEGISINMQKVTINAESCYIMESMDIEDEDDEW